MKKVILIFLIIFSVALCACNDNASADGNKSQSGAVIVPGESKQSFFDYMASLKAEDGTATDFTLTLSGGVEKTLKYKVSYADGGATGSVTDGDTVEFENFYLSGAENYYNEEVAKGKLDGNLKNVALKSPSELFLLSDETVKELFVKYNGDGTITYTPYIYEGVVKTAVLALQNQFEVTEDVLNLEFITDVLGSKVEIRVNLTAKYKNIDTPVKINLTVIYSRTIKTID